MDVFAVPLACQVADLQVAATLMPLAAGSQHMGYTATSSYLTLITGSAVALHCCKAHA